MLRSNWWCKLFVHHSGRGNLRLHFLPVDSTCVLTLKLVMVLMADPPWSRRASWETVPRLKNLLMDCIYLAKLPDSACCYGRLKMEGFSFWNMDTVTVLSPEFQHVCRNCSEEHHLASKMDLLTSSGLIFPSKESTILNRTVVNNSFLHDRTTQNLSFWWFTFAPIPWIAVGWQPFVSDLYDAPVQQFTLGALCHSVVGLLSWDNSSDDQRGQLMSFLDNLMDSESTSLWASWATCRHSLSEFSQLSSDRAGVQWWCWLHTHHSSRFLEEGILP